MMRSMFADQPYSEVVSTQGEPAMWEITMTFSKLSPNTSCRGGKQSSSPRPSSSSMLRPALEFHAIKLLKLLHA